MKKTYLILSFVMIILYHSFSQEDEPIRWSNLKNHLGLISCMTISAPVGVIGLLKINERTIDAPDDSILYYEKGEAYTVSDHNSDISKQMGIFLLCDLVSFYAIGFTIDEVLEKARERRKNKIKVKVFINTDMHNNKYSLNVCVPFGFK